MSKTKIGVRTEYFSRSQASGEIAHVLRNLPEDKNVLDAGLTKNNFGTHSDIIQQRWFDAMAVMPDTVKNTLIDSVLVLPVEQVEVMKKEHGKNWMKELHNAINDIGKDMENEMGFTFIGYKMHMDEGSYNDDGSIKLNTHAHMHFANICTKDVTFKRSKNVTVKDENGKAMRDPKNKSKWLFERDENGKLIKEVEEIQLKGRAPLSLMQARGDDSIWARQQDIAAKHLIKFGFERGDKKSLTNAKHLTKKKHVERVLNDMEKKVESLTLAEAAARKRLEALQNEFQQKLDAFIEEREDLFAKLLDESVDLDTLLKEEEKVESLFYKIYDEEVRQAAKDSSLERLNDVKPDDDKAFNFDSKFDALAAKMQSYEAKEGKPSTAPKIELGEIR